MRSGGRFGGRPVHATSPGGDLSTRTTDVAVAAGIALAGFVIVLMPAIAVRAQELLNAGVGSVDDDLLAASVAMGTVYMVVAWRRLRDEERIAGRRLHVWIASLNGLVVLALSASVLLLLVLYLFPDEHASLANRGFPVFLLLAGVQGVAILLAEATARLFFWWLEPRAPPTPGRGTPIRDGGGSPESDPGRSGEPRQPE